MENIYTKARFESLVHTYGCILSDKNEEIKSYKLQLKDIKERIDNILMYEKINRKSLEEVQELLELYI